MMHCREYKTFIGSECLLACFNNIIKYNNLNIDESDVFILGDGLMPKYCRTTGSKPGIILSGNVHESVFNFCNEYKVEIILQDGLSNADAKNLMLYYLSQNNPLTIKIDSGFLRYSPVYTNKHGFTHFINIVRYNQEINSVLLSDGYIPTIPPSIYHNWYDYRLVEKGRSLESNSFIIFKMDKLKDSNIIEEYKRVKLKENLFNYLKSHTKGNYIYGIKALQQFAADIPQIFEMSGDNFSNIMLKLNYDMKVNGLVTGKFLLYQAFQRLNFNKNYHKRYDLEKALEEIAKEWNKISLLVIRSGILKNIDNMLALAYRIKATVSKEEEVYNAILSVL